MTLVRLISLSCRLIFLPSCLFPLCSLTSFVSAGGERGGSAPAVTMERTGTLDYRHFSISPVCQCLHKSSNASFLKTLEIHREKTERPLRGHATSGGRQTNRQPGSSSGWAESGWTQRWWRWRGDEMVAPSVSQREREREMALILAWWHNDWSASWMLVVSPALRTEQAERRRRENTSGNGRECIHLFIGLVVI